MVNEPLVGKRHVKVTERKTKVDWAELIREIADEWMENIYYQYFGGAKSYACVPCEASDLVHFRNRIGQSGIELIFKGSIRGSGDNINVMLAAATMNFKRMMNIYKKMFLAFLFYVLK